MDRRTALQALLLMIAGAATSYATENEKNDEYGSGRIFIHIPETVHFDLTGVEAINIHWENHKIAIPICELVNALMSDQSGQVVYTPGRDLCK
jgi:hypothetical protein